MSSPELAQTQIEVEQLDEETMKTLINNLLKEQDKFKKEANLILVIRRDGRRSGCGYVYLYKNDYEVVVGEVQEVVLNSEERDCDWFENVAIIPLTVPVVIMEKYHDDDPQVHDYITIHVFGVDGWRSLKVFVPK
jgi:hypothetical protein